MSVLTVWTSEGAVDDMQWPKLDGAICLTARERDLAGLVVKGLSNKQVARQLGITEGTVKIHLHNIFQKLGVPNRTALTMLVHRRQTLLQEPPRGSGRIIRALSCPASSEASAYRPASEMVQASGSGYPPKPAPHL